MAKSVRSTPPPVLAFLFMAGLLCQPFAPPRATADVVNIPSMKDNTLYEDADGDTSNGAGDHIFVGHTNSTNVVRRGLVAFDLNAAGIPPGSTINSVTLTLYLSRYKSGTPNVSVHRVLKDWGEGTSDAPGEEGGGAPATPGDATWIYTFYPSNPWSTPGGDFVPGASATTPIPRTEGPYVWSSAGMIADVQLWADNPDTNFGWILIGQEADNRSARRFDSKENPTVSQRPTLTVDFVPGAVVGACCLPSDSCAVLSEADCLNAGGVYQGDGTNCTPNPCVIPTGACCFDNGTCDELTEADCLAGGGTYQGDGTSCSPGLCELILEPFVDPLPVPAPAVPTTGVIGGVATYDIEMTQFKQQLHRDLDSTTVWGYDGSYPGPTIEAYRDLPVTVNWINDLRDSTGALRTTHYFPVDLCPHGAENMAQTVVHLHGGHIPALVDGYPEDKFPPGQQVNYVYPNHQDAATLWYHDHALGITRLNVMMGLAGFYLLRDSVETALDLPDGMYEIPLVFQDRTFNPDGSLQYPAVWQDHFFGDKILVNGKVWPYLDVDQGKYRFRMLDGSNSRAYSLHLSTGDPITVIGTEGGLLTVPVAVDTLTLTPGERYDVVVDFAGYSAGTEVLLVNTAPAPFPGPPGQGVVSDVMKFIVQGSPGHVDALPDTLRPVADIPESTAVESRDFKLEKTTDPCSGTVWLINNLDWDTITEYPVLGSTEIWRFINPSGVTHPMHMHLVMFQVLDRQLFTAVGDSIVPVGDPFPPDSTQMGWKDTVPVYPGEMVRVIARFEDYLGQFPYHCHILEHEDHEMMRQFEVVSAPIGVGEISLPAGLTLAPTFPNPFSARTTIEFSLPEPSIVSLRVFDIAGREVRTLVDGPLSEASHSVAWDGRDDYGRDVGGGIYFLRLAAGDRVLSRKVMRIR